VDWLGYVWAGTWIEMGYERRWCSEVQELQVEWVLSLQFLDSLWWVRSEARLIRVWELHRGFFFREKHVGIDVVRLGQRLSKVWVKEVGVHSMNM